jgi:hypothetical protein
MEDGDKPSSSSQGPGSQLLDKVPPNIRDVVTDYVAVAKSLLFAPIVFYRGMDKKGGMKHAVIFFVTSSAVGSIIAGVVGLNPLSIPKTLGLSIILTFAASAIAFGLCKAMGAKGSFEATFKVFAYSSCLKIFSAIPILNLLAIFWTAALNFYGLKEVHQLGTVKTASVIFLTSLLLTLLEIGHYLHLI